MPGCRVFREAGPARQTKGRIARTPTESRTKVICSGCRSLAKRVLMRALLAAKKQAAASMKSAPRPFADRLCQ